MAVLQVVKENSATATCLRRWELTCDSQLTAAVARLLEQSCQSPRIRDFDALVALGETLATTLPTDLRLVLQESPDFLYLLLDDRDQYFPLEICRINGRFLGLQSAIGRTTTAADVIAPISERPIRGGILANSMFDLFHTEVEAESVRQLWNQMNGVAANHFAASAVLITEALACLGQCDWLHLCGHADCSDYGATWRFSDGSLCSETLQVAKLARGPRFIFANACGSLRRPKTWSEDWLPIKFQALGCQHFLGTTVKILDEDAKIFSKRFYEFLRSGATIGAAVVAARRSVADEKFSAKVMRLSWASYDLLGDPRVRMVEPHAPRRCFHCGRIIHTEHGIGSRDWCGGRETVKCRPCTRLSRRGKIETSPTVSVSPIVRSVPADPQDQVLPERSGPIELVSKTVLPQRIETEKANANIERAVSAIERQLPLEVSLGETQLVTLLKLPQPIVVTAMREAAHRFRLHLDEIPGFGWVLS